MVPGGLNLQVPTTEVVQQYLEDNESLIRTILECINAGRVEDAVTYQQRLQQNLMWLAGIADSQAPPTPSASAPAPGSAVPPMLGQPAAPASGQQVVHAAHAAVQTAQQMAAQQAPARPPVAQETPLAAPAAHQPPAAQHPG
ncbi:g8762 [Coccomyxa elongata]